MENQETLEPTNSDKQLQAKFKAINLKEDTHTELDKIRAEKRLRTFQNTVEFLVEFFKQHQAA